MSDAGTGKDMIRMHDWILLSILYEWEAARATLSFHWRDEKTLPLVADGVSELRVPQLKEWGPSVSVNRVRGPSEELNGRRRLEIEMQTGDVIEIEAAAYAFPPGAL